MEHVYWWKNSKLPKWILLSIALSPSPSDTNIESNQISAMVAMHHLKIVFMHFIWFIVSLFIRNWIVVIDFF